MEYRMYNRYFVLYSITINNPQSKGKIMDTFEAIAADILRIDAEVERTAKREGFESRHHCTGKVLVDPVNEAVWYQMADEYNTTTYVSLSYPQNTAWDEILVCVDDEKDALSYADDYNL